VAEYSERLNGGGEFLALPFFFKKKQKESNLWWSDQPGKSIYSLCFRRLKGQMKGFLFFALFLSLSLSGRSCDAFTCRDDQGILLPQCEAGRRASRLQIGETKLDGGGSACERRGKRKSVVMGYLRCPSHLSARVRLNLLDRAAVAEEIEAFNVFVFAGAPDGEAVKAFLSPNCEAYPAPVLESTGKNCFSSWASTQGSHLSTVVQCAVGKCEVEMLAETYCLSSAGTVQGLAITGVIFMALGLAMWAFIIVFMWRNQLPFDLDSSVTLIVFFVYFCLGMAFYSLLLYDAVTLGANFSYFEAIHSIDKLIMFLYVLLLLLLLHQWVGAFHHEKQKLVTWIFVVTGIALSVVFIGLLPPTYTVVGGISMGGISTAAERVSIALHVFLYGSQAILVVAFLVYGILLLRSYSRAGGSLKDSGGKRLISIVGVLFLCMIARLITFGILGHQSISVFLWGGGVSAPGIRDLFFYSPGNLVVYYLLVYLIPNVVPALGLMLILMFRLYDAQKYRISSNLEGESAAVPLIPEQYDV
jgi:hypothetical protein